MALSENQIMIRILVQQQTYYLPNLVENPSNVLPIDCAVIYFPQLNVIF